MRTASVIGPLTAVGGATKTAGWTWTSRHHPWVWTRGLWTPATRKSCGASARWRKRTTSWFRWGFIQPAQARSPLSFQVIFQNYISVRRLLVLATRHLHGPVGGQRPRQIHLLHLQGPTWWVETISKHTDTPWTRRFTCRPNKLLCVSGQRQSLRYWYDREWLSSGHMYGLSFLQENYSHQNAKKITTTHQLLGDVHHLVEVLNGLQLKMSILKWVHLKFSVRY